MSELFDDKKTHMSYVVSQLGAYPYKEIVDKGQLKIFSTPKSDNDFFKEVLAHGRAPKP